MDQRIEKPGTRSMNPWTAALVVAALVLVVLVIGGYTLNWTWTGFKGNTLWDWLHLLILPVVLTAVAIWFTKRPKWRVEWTVLLVAALLVLVVLAIGSYAFNWKWTGFRGNTLWNWLELLVLPAALAFVPLWVAAHEDRASRMTHLKS